MTEYKMTTAYLTFFACWMRWLSLIEFLLLFHQSASALVQYLDPALEQRCLCSSSFVALKFLTEGRRQLILKCSTRWAAILPYRQRLQFLLTVANRWNLMRQLERNYEATDFHWLVVSSAITLVPKGHPSARRIYSYGQTKLLLFCRTVTWTTLSYSSTNKLLVEACLTGPIEGARRWFCCVDTAGPVVVWMPASGPWGAVSTIFPSRVAYQRYVGICL